MRGESHGPGNVGSGCKVASIRDIELATGGAAILELRGAFDQARAIRKLIRLSAETLHIDGCTLPGDHEGDCDV